MEVKFTYRPERNKPGSVRILNKIVTVTDQGLEYEADQRHAEILMEDMCIGERSKGVATPEVVSTGEGGQVGEGEARQQGGESIFRAVAASGTTWVRIAWTCSSRRRRCQGARRSPKSKT